MSFFYSVGYSPRILCATATGTATIDAGGPLAFISYLADVWAWGSLTVGDGITMTPAGALNFLVTQLNNGVSTGSATGALTCTATRFAGTITLSNTHVITFGA